MNEEIVKRCLTEIKCPFCDSAVVQWLDFRLAEGEISSGVWEELTYLYAPDVKPCSHCAVYGEWKILGEFHIAPEWEKEISRLGRILDDFYRANDQPEFDELSPESKAGYLGWCIMDLSPGSDIIELALEEIFPDGGYHFMDIRLGEGDCFYEAFDYGLIFIREHQEQADK